MHIPAKTLTDLEFPVVLEQLAAHCITEAGANAAAKIVPIKEEGLILNALGKTKEYLDSFELDTVIPNHRSFQTTVLTQLTMKSGCWALKTPPLKLMDFAGS